MLNIIYSDILERRELEDGFYAIKTKDCWILVKAWIEYFRGPKLKDLVNLVKTRQEWRKEC